jgi:hypothetical protein
MPSGNTLFPPLVHLCSSRMLIPSKLVTYESCLVSTSIKYSTSKNKFVHLALQNSIAIASEIVGISSVNDTLSTGIDIAIVGDNDFYSQRQNVIDLLSFVSLMKLIGCVDHTAVFPRSDICFVVPNLAVRPDRRHSIQRPQDRSRLLSSIDYIPSLRPSLTFLGNPTLFIHRSQ